MMLLLSMTHLRDIKPQSPHTVPCLPFYAQDFSSAPLSMCGCGHPARHPCKFRQIQLKLSWLSSLRCQTFPVTPRPFYTRGSPLHMCLHSIPCGHPAGPRRVTPASGDRETTPFSHLRPPDIDLNVFRGNAHFLDTIGRIRWQRFFIHGAWALQTLAGSCLQQPRTVPCAPCL